MSLEGGREGGEGGREGGRKEGEREGWTVIHILICMFKSWRMQSNGTTIFK